MNDPQDPTGTRKRFVRAVMRGGKTVSQVALCTGVLVLIVEGAMRLVGRPDGRFLGMGADAPGTTGVVTWGVVPYFIHINDLGFRGPETTVEKPAGTKRIIALGDSITYGLFVDEGATFPAQLQEKIEAGDHDRWEVFNFGIPGVSIDYEYYFLRKHGMALSPDVVVLSYVQNDLAGIRGMSKERILRGREAHGFAGAIRDVAKFLLYETAMGELSFDLLLSFTTEHYRAHEDKDDAQLTDARYQIPGASDFEKNIEIAEGLARRARENGIESPLSEETLALLETYLSVLDHLNRYLAARDCRLVLAFVPGYGQANREKPFLGLRDKLSERVPELGIPFLDLVPAFVAARERGDIMHLAPIDFHITPVGNRIIAKAVYDFLVKESILNETTQDSGVQPQANRLAP